MENSKSTQISDIIGDKNVTQTDQSQSELVQEIINEIKMQEQDNSQNDIDTSVMDEKVHAVPRSETNNVNYTLLDNNVNENKDTDKEDNNSLWFKLKKYLSWSFLKDVLVVSCIILLLSLSLVNKNIVQLIPKMGNEIGEINLLGNIMKSLVGGLLFFIVKLII